MMVAGAATLSCSNGAYATRVVSSASVNMNSLCDPTIRFFEVAPNLLVSECAITTEQFMTFSRSVSTQDLASTLCRAISGPMISHTACVTLEEAQAYCSWLGASLVTESQWRVALLAGIVPHDWEWCSPEGIDDYRVVSAMGAMPAASFMRAFSRQQNVARFPFRAALVQK